MISLNFIDSVKLVHQEMESNLRQKREKIVRERKEEISIKLTIAVPAEEFQRKRLNAMERRWHIL
jgi:hypothetical protein